MKNPENIRDLEKQAAVFLHLGGAAEQKHDFEAAVTFYRRAIALEPTRLDVWYFAHNNLGFSLNQLGRFSDGEIFCQDAIRIDPSRPNGHKNLGLSLANSCRLMYSYGGPLNPYGALVVNLIALVVGKDYYNSDPSSPSDRYANIVGATLALKLRSCQKGCESSLRSQIAKYCCPIAGKKDFDKDDPKCCETK